MSGNLSQCFKRYVDLLKTRIARKQRVQKTTKLFTLLRNEAVDLRSKLTAIEQHHPLFQDLVSETCKTFADGQWENAAWLQLSYSDIRRYEWDDFDLATVAIANFFRRSRCYIDVYETTEVNIKSLFDLYREAFENDKIRYTYYVPLDCVLIRGPAIEIGDFTIKRFAENDLEEALRNKVSKLFYPSASVDSKLLETYWYLVATEERTLAEQLEIVQKQWEVAEISIELEQKYSQYPAVLKSLRLVALYDWHIGKGSIAGTILGAILGTDNDLDGVDRSREKAQHKGEKLPRIEGIYNCFKPFQVPFLLKVHDNLLIRPDRYDGNIVPYGTSIHEEVFTGSYYSDIEIESDSLDSFFKGVIAKLGAIRTKGVECAYLDAALDYLYKAFFSTGLEQLLWHIAVLEALLGDRTETTESLRRRLANIFGYSQESRKDLRKLVGELYNLRSDLVHGKLPDARVSEFHLFLARNMARMTLIWFIYCLDDLAKALKKKKQLEKLSKDYILVLLDLSEKKELPIESLFKRLPEGFPCVKNWLG